MDGGEANPVTVILNQVAIVLEVSDDFLMNGPCRILEKTNLMERQIKSLFLIFSFFFFSITSAQFKVLSESSTFDEPEDVVSRIIQMKNGNTFYVHLTQKEGIDFRIYDPSHRQTVVSSVTPSFGKLRKPDTGGCPTSTWATGLRTAPRCTTNRAFNPTRCWIREAGIASNKKAMHDPPVFSLCVCFY